MIFWTESCWRRPNFASFWRLLPSIFFAILTFTGFIVAGIFSSAITTTMGQEVLLQGSNCGRWKIFTNDTERSNLEHAYFSKTVAASFAYAQRCYRKDANPRDCAIFFQPRLQWKSYHNTTCPFPNKDICISDSGNLRLDSGYINSDHHLGINSSPKTRFLIRTVVECAPLRTKGYSRNSTIVPINRRSEAMPTDDGTPFTRDKVTEYFYGKCAYSEWNSTYHYSAKTPDMNSYYIIGEAPISDYVLRSVDR